MSKCLVGSAKAIFQSDFSPALAYVASDEINLLFLYTAPFGPRVEKTDSILPGVVSSAFSLSLRKFFQKTSIASFDARIIVSSLEKIAQYLACRQADAWRNHNNAYAYWVLRKAGHKLSEAAKTLKNLKFKDLHDLILHPDVNVAQTLAWQRRGILIYRKLYKKRMENRVVTRRRIRENWNLPLVTSKDGKALIQKILERAKPTAE
ncbi:MAG: hypothetical protein GWN31_03915 [Candidatus Thorarchaeota archaeon]|nr:hypothetical protein [Candidatus Thorarchaeota archaeon]